MALVHKVHIHNFGMINEKSKTNKKRKKIGYNYSIISTVT